MDLGAVALRHRGQGQMGRAQSTAKYSEVELDMWRCPRCRGHTFAMRDRCFDCGERRPINPFHVRESWKANFLPADVQAALALRQHRQTDETGRPSDAQHGTRNASAEQKGGKGNGGQREGDGAKGSVVGILPVGRVEKQVRVGMDTGGAGSEARTGVLTGKGPNTTLPTMPPGARPKAAPTPPSEQKEKPQAAQDEWPSLPSRYVPPTLSRVEATGRLEALEAREGELAECDPRKEKVAEKIRDAKQMVKEAGGRTRHKLHFNILDGDKELEKRERAVEEARDALGAAHETTVAAVEHERKMEAELEARLREVDNCKARNCHWVFQAAMEAAMGLGGYNELAASTQYVGATLAANGAVHAERAYEQISAFVRKFAPQHYERQNDPVLAELESADTESIATVCVGQGAMDWREAEAQGEAGAIAQEGLLPKAFETAIVAQEVARTAALRAQEENLPESWKKERQRAERESLVAGENKGVCKVGGAKRSVGERRGCSVDVGVRSKCVKGLGKKQSTTLAKRNQSRGRAEDRAAMGGKETEGEERARSWDPSMEWTADGRGKRKRQVDEAQRRETSRNAPRNTQGDGQKAEGGETKTESALVLHAERKTGARGRGERSRSSSRHESRKKAGGMGMPTAAEGEKPRDGGKRRGWEEEDPPRAEAQPLFHCLGCGDGPMHGLLLAGKCVCGGPLCRERAGANSCLRCNGASTRGAAGRILV